MALGTTAYPSALDTDSTIGAGKDYAATTLSAAISNVVTTFNVTSGAALVSTGGVILIDDELMSYGSITSNTLNSVTRGIGGTTAANHNILSVVTLVVAALYHNVSKDAIVAIQTELGTLPKGAFSDVKARLTAVDALLVGAAGGDLSGNYPNPTIGANKVTLAKLATQADQTTLGNVSGGTAVPSALSVSQMTTMLKGTSSTTLCVGNDSRLSDSRAPSGTASGDLAGSYPSPTLAKATSVTGQIEFAKGAAVASANNLALGTDGNVFHITGTTQINLLSSTGWQAGSLVLLIFDGILTVKNNQTVSSANKPILLLGGVDYVTAANSFLELVYDGTSWFDTRLGILIGTAQISANAVTLAKLATQADQTTLGNVSGGAAVPVALTVAQMTTMLAGITGSTLCVGNDSRFSTITGNNQVASYTLVLTDAGKVVEMNNASANTLTIPPVSSVVWPVGTVIEVWQQGAGQCTITAGAGVTLRSDGTKVKTAAQYATVALRMRANDEWVLSGDLA